MKLAGMNMISAIVNRHEDNPRGFVVPCRDDLCVAWKKRKGSIDTIGVLRRKVGSHVGSRDLSDYDGWERGNGVRRDRRWRMRIRKKWRETEHNSIYWFLCYSLRAFFGLIFQNKTLSFRTFAAKLKFGWGAGGAKRQRFLYREVCTESNET